MKIDTDALKKQVILHLPYLLFLLVFAKLGEAVRLAPGADASQKLLGLSEGFTLAFQSMWPGAALDWLVGLCGAVIVRLAVYLRGKDAKTASNRPQARFAPLFLPVSRRAEKFCVNNSKKHLTKCFMGQQNRHCPFYGPETGKQHYPDADRGAYDVRQAEESGPCPQ